LTIESTLQVLFSPRPQPGENSSSKNHLNRFNGFCFMQGAVDTVETVPKLIPTLSHRAEATV